MQCIVAASLEANSKLILPVPEQRSNTFVPSMGIMLPNKLNNPSLAKSVVGLTGKFFGGLNLLPLSLPLIIRTGID